MKFNNNELINMIGNDNNHQKDYAVMIKLINRRDKQMDLEQEIFYSKGREMGSAKCRGFLKEIKELESSVTDPTLYSLYYNELARAYELTGSYVESFTCCYSGLQANRLVGDNDGAYISARMMSEYAHALGDTVTTVHWLDECDKIPSEHKLTDVGYEQTERNALKKTPGMKPSPIFASITTKEAFIPLSSNDDEVRFREIAARRIRRSTNVSIEKARKMVESLDINEIKSAIGKFAMMKLDQRFQGEEHDTLTDNLDFQGEDYLPTERESGQVDKNGEMVYEGSVIIAEGLGMFRIAFHNNEWYCLTGMMAGSFSDIDSSQMELVKDEGIYKQVITKSEWLYDNGPTL